MSTTRDGVNKAYDDGHAQLWLADARDMSFLPDGSVDCIVTSPPYWSLRKYGGGAVLVWDAAEGCEHVWDANIAGGIGYTGGTKQWHDVGGRANLPANALVKHTLGQFCQLCGAWRGQLGLEPTIEFYLDHLLQILDVECRRVLKDSGMMVVNMGDSYASGSGMAKSSWDTFAAYRTDGGAGKRAVGMIKASRNFQGLKPLDLCMIPARFALAMQQRGWYLRSVVPWLKQAAMPDSVQGDRWERHKVKVKSGKGAGDTHPSKHPGGLDRTITSPTGAYGHHVAEWKDCSGCPKCLLNDGLVLRKGNWRPGRSMEWLFLLSKTNDYYSDAEGVRKAQTEWSSILISGKEFGGQGNHLPLGAVSGFGERTISRNPAGRNRRQGDWLYESLDAVIAQGEREIRRLKHLRDKGGMLWEDGEPLALLLNPKGYKEAHFATYPIAMVEPFIKSYTSERGNCPKCGKAWVRVVERTRPNDYDSNTIDGRAAAHAMKASSKPSTNRPLSKIFKDTLRSTINTLGWCPQCQCDAGEPIPAVVLDPFVGSGTTCAAATKLGRRSIGVDCVEEYIALAIKRLGGPYEVETKEGIRVRQQGLFE